MITAKGSYLLSNLWWKNGGTGRRKQEQPLVVLTNHKNLAHI